MNVRRLAMAAVLAAGAVGGMTLTDHTPTAEAAPNDVVAVVVEGTGFGHGRGMSQWGAYGYAVDHGWSWGQILDHYYGGTNSGTVASGQRIKVRLLGYDGLSTVGVVSHGSPVKWGGHTATSMYAKETSAGVFQVYGANSISCPSSSALTVPDGPLSRNDGVYVADVERVQAFLKAFHDGSVVVDGYFGPQTAAVLVSWQSAEGLTADGVWNSNDAARARAIIAAAGGSVSWNLLGTHTATAGNPVRFTSTNGENSSASKGSVLGVCNGSGAVNHYRGAIDVLHTSSGNRVSNDVKVEDYVRGVIPKEIAASWADSGGGAGVNAVRAQAVAARSYGLSQNRSYFYDGGGVRYATTCDSTSCQVYAGSAKRSSATGTLISVEDGRTDAAVSATANVVRKWSGGAIVSTEFSASNGPRTAGGAFPPVNDIGDDTDRNPNHRWTRVLDADTLASRYGLGTLIGASMVQAQSGTYQGFDGIWFNDILLTGTNGTFRQQAWDFRNAEGLKSPGFTVRVVTEDTTNKKMALIGDSVGNSIAHTDGEFRSVTDGTYSSQTIDVRDSRCTTNTSCPGTSGVEAAASVPAGLDLAVVELGYNDSPSGFADDIDAMMAALVARGVKQVAWVNMADIRRSGGRLMYTPSNQALVAAQGRWPTLTVLDWDTASDHPERPRWFSGDGVHLTATGQAEFALWLRSEMLALVPPHYLAPPKRLEIPVRGVKMTAPDGSIITVPDDASAVALNLISVRSSGPGYATVWPCEGGPPEVSNLNFPGGDNRTNSVIAPIGPDGTVCVYSSVGTDAVVDIAGWFAGSSSSFRALSPRRHVDTRIGLGGRSGKVTPSAPLSVPVVGASVTTVDGDAVAIPASATAAAVNVTIVQPERGTFATVWPCGVDRPLASNVNFERGVNTANGVVAPIGANGSICVYSDTNAHVLVDVAGWFEGGNGPGFSAATPTRLVDTRPGAVGPAGLVTPSSPLVVPVAGRVLNAPGGSVTVPADATAVALNFTVARPSGDGFATLWPCGIDRPEASNANFRRGENVANGVVAPIGIDGTICIHVSAPTYAIVDVAGWFRGGNDPAFVGAVPQRFVDTRFAIGPVPT